MGMEKIEKKMILKEPNKKIKERLIQAQNAHRDNHLEDLEKILKEIVLIDPNYFPAIFNLGKLSEKLKKYVFSDTVNTEVVKNTFGDSSGVIGAADLGR